jgi:hypothetical protein
MHAKVQRGAKTAVARQQPSLIDDVGMSIKDGDDTGDVATAGGGEQLRERLVR